MPRLNSRAIAKLEDAAKCLDKLERRDLTRGPTFARALCDLMRTGKELKLVVDGRSQTFKPCDVRVSRTRVTLGTTSLTRGTIQSGDEGGFEVHDNSEAYPISIATT
jgi:hypothetical protein